MGGAYALAMGTVRLLLIAGTHVPDRARDLPLQVWDGVGRADVVVHASDWVDVAVHRLPPQRPAR